MSAASKEDIGSVRVRYCRESEWGHDVCGAKVKSADEDGIRDSESTVRDGAGTRTSS
jgi:hypothetical protein